MRYRPSLLSALAFLAFCSNAHAGNIGFNLNELSATTLDSSLAGVTITNVAADKWDVNFSGTGITLIDSNSGNDAGGTAWTEPNSNLVSLVTILSSSELEVDMNVTNPGGIDCGAYHALSNQTCAVGTGNGNAYFVDVSDDVPKSAVPEPSTLALLGAALGAAALVRRRKG
jgi:PEP-CTERM motif